MKNLLLLLIGCLFSLASFAQNVLDFNGTSAFVQITSTPALRMANNFTLEAWIKLVDVVGVKMIVSHDENGNGDDAYIFRVNGSKLEFSALNLNTFADQTVTSTTNLTAGTWFHVAGVYDNSVLKLYVNGSLEVTKNATGDVAYEVTSKVIIGRRAFSSSQFMKGQIDELRIWNIPLTTSQIATLFNDEFSDPTTPSSCLVAYYQMSNGSGTSLTDNSGNGNTGTITVATWVSATPTGLASATAPTCASLPVELTYFNATPIEGEALLTWQTATELNNEGFEVQKAAGNAALEAGRWQVLAFVEGNGTTNEVQNYSYTDERPQVGLNYYRLKQIDFDGKFEFSDIVLVEVRGDGEGGIQIFPNPAPSDELTLYLPETNDGKAIIRLYDQTGKLALQQTTSSQQQTLNVSQLPAGIYFVEVRVGGKVFREKVVVE